MSTRGIDKEMVKYLVDKYDLDGPKDVRRMDLDGRIECRGEYPNARHMIGYFFAGFEDEIRQEMDRENEYKRS